MERLLNFLTKGKTLHILDSVFAEANAAIPGFVIQNNIGKGNQLLCAPDGQQFELKDFSFCYGNFVWVELKDKAEPEKDPWPCVKFGQIFPQGTKIVLAVKDENVVAFAPVCTNGEQLNAFLAEVQEFAKIRKSEVSPDFYENFQKLATWLYCHH